MLAPERVNVPLPLLMRATCLAAPFWITPPKPVDAPGLTVKVVVPPLVLLSVIVPDVPAREGRLML